MGTTSEGHDMAVTITDPQEILRQANTVLEAMLDDQRSSAWDNDNTNATIEALECALGDLDDWPAEVDPVSVAQVMTAMHAAARPWAPAFAVSPATFAVWLAAQGRTDRDHWQITDMSAIDMTVAVHGGFVSVRHLPVDGEGMPVELIAADPFITKGDTHVWVAPSDLGGDPAAVAVYGQARLDGMDVDDALDVARDALTIAAPTPPRPAPLQRSR